MTLSQNYNQLLKDTISYLENLDEKHITLSSENLSFYSEEISKKTFLKKEKNVFHVRKMAPLNIDIAKIKEPSVKLPIPAPIKEEIKPPEKKEFIKLEAPKPLYNPLTDIKEIFLKISPPENYIENPLDDKQAQEIKEKWKYQTRAAAITILAYKENPKAYKFLEQLAIALDLYFMPTKLISAYFLEKNNHWDSFLSASQLSLVITSDNTIYELKNLKRFYREIPTASKFYLKEKDLFILPDISIYFKEPLLKKSLFISIKQKITSLEGPKNG